MIILDWPKRKKRRSQLQTNHEQSIWIWFIGMIVRLCVVVDVCRSSSWANFDPLLRFHPLVGRRMITMARCAVVAVHALALRPAFYSCSEALAVVFAAWGFLACAPFGGDERRNSQEMAWVAVVCHLLRVIDGVAVFGVILAACADAISVAEATLSEAFAV